MEQYKQQLLDLVKQYETAHGDSVYNVDDYMHWTFEQAMDDVISVHVAILEFKQALEELCQ